MTAPDEDRSPSLPVVSRSSALQLARDAVLHGAPSPFASLAILASLRDRGNGAYFHSSLAVQLATAQIHSILAELHSQVFLEWLRLPLDGQIAAVEQHFRTDAAAPPITGVAAFSCENYIPDSAEMPERVLFEADLAIILRLLKAKQSDSQAPNRLHYFRLATGLQRIKLSSGDIRLVLKDLSEGLGVPQNGLGRAFRQHSGVAFRKYLFAARMFTAATLLKSSPLNLKQVASMLGYSKESNLCRDFRKAYGKSATSYRRQAVVRNDGHPLRGL
jgi:AraC-like DNA-binding protein